MIGRAVTIGTGDAAGEAGGASGVGPCIGAIGVAGAGVAGIGVAASDAVGKTRVSAGADVGVGSSPDDVPQPVRTTMKQSRIASGGDRARGVAGVVARTVDIWSRVKINA